jgi:hypothetical protein
MNRSELRRLARNAYAGHFVWGAKLLDHETKLIEACEPGTLLALLDALDLAEGSIENIENSLRFPVPSKTQTEMANFLQKALAAIEKLCPRGGEGK